MRKQMEEKTAKPFLLLAALALVPMSNLRAAQAAGTPRDVFHCSVGQKSVAVTAVGNRLTYHYGTPQKEELSIIGDPGAGNVFWMSQRMAGMEYQLRFKNGPYSYIIYSAEGNARSGASSVSGLVIMKGSKQIGDESCSRFAEFDQAFDFGGLPQDTDQFSAM